MTGQQQPTREQIEKYEALLAEWRTESIDVEMGRYRAVNYGHLLADSLREVLALFPQPFDSVSSSSPEGTPAVQHEETQPTPSAEPKPLNPDAMQRALDYHGWPPSIASMAPGTEFTSEGDGVPGVEHRFRVTGERDSRGVPYLFCTIHRTGARAAYVDPSTIRDVTPPATTPEAN